MNIRKKVRYDATNKGVNKDDISETLKTIK